MANLDLGWCDLCLRVQDVVQSRKFYESLGFRKVEGKDEEGWAVMAHDTIRLGLYQPKHMGEAILTLNFRGSHVGKVVEELTALGHQFEANPKINEDGSGSAFLKDPDGHMLFFDTFPGETKPE